MALKTPFIVEKSVVKGVDGRYYLVSSVMVQFAPAFREYETMVFSADINGKVSSYMDLYCRVYDNENSARIGHFDIAAKVANGSISLKPYVEDDDNV